MSITSVLIYLLCLAIGLGTMSAASKLSFKNVKLRYKNRIRYCIDIEKKDRMFAIFPTVVYLEDNTDKEIHIIWMSQDFSVKIN